MEPTTELVYIGVGRTISALDRFTGKPVWRRKLPGFLGGFVTLAVDGDLLVAGRGGYVYGLDRLSGEVLWERGVGLHGGTVMIAAPRSETSDAAAVMAAASAQAAAAASASG